MGFMLDQEAIVQIINSALPVAASSPVIIKLISTIEDVVKTLYAPAVIIRNGKAEVDVELYRREKLGDYPNSQTFTYFEMAKLKNFLKASSFAAEELSSNDNKENEPIDYGDIDFDWVMRFFDAVGNISNESLQRLWGKIFAGEIKNSGSCSLRTIDIIRNMTSKEAKSYASLCEYVLISGDMPFILGSGFHDLETNNELSHKYMADAGLSFYYDILPMLECGLLMDNQDLATDFRTNSVLEMHNQIKAYFVVADEGKKNFMNVSAYFLTRSGIELYSIISSSNDFQANTEYPDICMEEFKKDYPDLKFTSSKISDLS